MCAPFPHFESENWAQNVKPEIQEVIQTNLQPANHRRQCPLEKVERLSLYID